MTDNRDDPDVTFTPTDKRFLPAGAANEDEIPDVEAYVRATVRHALPWVTNEDEITDLVAQGLLIAEEIRREAPLGEFQQALAARLANRLRDYRREQYPEVRRNTRAKYKAAAAGEEYVAKVWAATGLAPEHGDVWGRDPEPVDRDATDDEVIDADNRRRILNAFANASSPEWFQENPHIVKDALGIASLGKIGAWQASAMWEHLEDLREDERVRPPKFGVLINPDDLI